MSQQTRLVGIVFLSKEEEEKVLTTLVKECENTMDHRLDFMDLRYMTEQCHHGRKLRVTVELEEENRCCFGGSSD